MGLCVRTRTNLMVHTIGYSLASLAENLSCCRHCSTRPNPVHGANAGQSTIHHRRFQVESVKFEQGCASGTRGFFRGVAVCKDMLIFSYPRRVGYFHNESLVRPMSITVSAFQRKSTYISNVTCPGLNV